VLAVLEAAAFFGVGAPLAKALPDSISHWLLAGLLDLGSGAGLLPYRMLRGSEAGSCLETMLLPFISATATDFLTAGSLPCTCVLKMLTIAPSLRLARLSRFSGFDWECSMDFSIIICAK